MKTHFTVHVQISRTEHEEAKPSDSYGRGGSAEKRDVYEELKLTVRADTLNEAQGKALSIIGMGYNEDG